MSATRLRQPPSRGMIAAGALAAFVAAGALLYIGHRNGPAVALLALVGLAGALLLVGNPKVALFAFVLVGVLAEENSDWGVNLSAVYNHGTAQPSPFEALEGLAIVAVLLYLASTRLPPRLPRPFGLTLMFTLVALLSGTAVGLTAGVHSASAYLTTIDGVIPILLVPFLVVNVIRDTDQLKNALAIGMGLIGFKAVAGLFVYFSGLAVSDPAFGRLTYYLPTTNLLLMLYLLGMWIAFLSGTKLPRWTWWITPLVFLALLLSYRRAMWLGTGLGCLLVLFPATGRLGRRLIVPGVLVFGVAIYLALGTGIAGSLQGPIVNRISSINSSKISQNEQDSYRIGERHNVWDAIERSPISGLGIGVPWAMRYPLSFTYVGGNEYVHIAALWWWMKMGLLGLAAYLLLIGSAVFVGIRVWRTHPDPQVRVFGLAAAGMTVGLVIVEVTSTAVGDLERTSAMFGFILGMLAVANSYQGLKQRAKRSITLMTR